MCTTSDFVKSFSSIEDAFFFLGRASYRELTEREHAIAEEKRVVPKYFVFDTETCGTREQLCVQLAWCAYDAEKNVVEKYSQIFRLPRGKKINFFATRVHGIDDARLAREGVDPRPELEFFLNWAVLVLANGGTIVAHNVNFDVGVIANTCKTWRVPNALSLNNVFCTMRAATPHCGLIDKRGRIKWPKLSELFKILHDGREAEGRLHDALVDTEVAASCFFKGIEKGWW